MKGGSGEQPGDNLAGILVVGNEILEGIVLDTNTQWIIGRLKPMGFHVLEAITVRDDLAGIGRGLRRLMGDGCRLIFTSGGLGPTHDDMTVQGVATELGLPVELNKEAMAIVARQYQLLHERGAVDSGELTEARRKMAMLPRGAKALDNRVGGAPGVIVEAGGSTILLLPGVPRELMWIFDYQVAPLLRGRVGDAYAERVVELPFRDESTLSPIIDQVMAESPGVYVKSLVRPHGEAGMRLWVSCMGESHPDAEARVARAVDLLSRIAGERQPDRGPNQI